MKRMLSWKTGLKIGVNRAHLVIFAKYAFSYIFWFTCKFLFKNFF